MKTSTWLLVVGGLGLALFLSLVGEYGVPFAAATVLGCILAASGVALPLIAYMIYKDRNQK